MPSDIEILSSDAPAPEAAAEPAISADNSTPVDGATPAEAAVTDAQGAATDPANSGQTPAQPQAGQEPQEDDLVPPDAVLEDALTVKALNDKIAKSPELQAIFTKDPGLKNLLYGNARMAQQTAKYKEIFQTPELARTALDLASQHIEFDNALRGTPAKIMDVLFERTAARDAAGNIDYNTPNEAYNQVFVSQREGHLWPYLNSLAADTKNADLKDAIAIVAQALGDKIQTDSQYYGNKQNQPAAKPQHDPETAAKLARLDELERGQQDQQAQQTYNYNQGILNGIGDSVSKAAGSYFDNLVKTKPGVVVTDFIKNAVIEKSIAEVYKLAENDPSYKNHVGFIYQSARNKDAALSARIVAEATKYARERLPRIIAKHLGEASKGVVASQQQRLGKQQQQTRPEVQGAAGVSTPSRPDRAAQIKEFMNKNKRRPSDREILDFD